MYLKKMTITNFRKFGSKNNVIEFVDAKDNLQGNKINISSATTLIIGKNNSGKTTISIALDKLLDNKSFNANDFNFLYLDRLIKTYLKDHFLCSPYLEFIVVIGFEVNNQDLITNLAPFINLEKFSQSENNNNLAIKIKYELKEVEDFYNNVKQIGSHHDNQTQDLRGFPVLKNIL